MIKKNSGSQEFQLAESKFLAYMDSVSRFISYAGPRKSIFEKLRKLMVIAYMALERVEQSGTYNKLFYVYYEPLIEVAYGQAMLKNPSNWPGFKDFIYDAAFLTLQGKKLDVKKFRKSLMAQLEFPTKAWKVLCD